MYCETCGAKLEDDALFCVTCGAPIEGEDLNITPHQNHQKSSSLPSPSIGFSARIHDPAFKKYVKNSNRYAVVFSVAIALIAVIGFYIAGERGAEGMSNPESLYIGVGIGSMFMLIALFQVLGRKGSKTWDGVVIDKKSEKKKKRVTSSDNSTYTKNYTAYTITIKDERGKHHQIHHEDDTTVYDYYTIGDRIRHHGGLNSYEKFDKTRDSIIFCAACATLCAIEDDQCPRCKCPLLK